jgi:chromosome partitioning protein
VAKTTTAINLAAALGERGQKVLLVDLDPQGNATTGIGVAKKELALSTYDVIMGEARPSEAVIKTGFENLWVMPATQSLAEAEVRLLKFDNKNLQLRKALLQVEQDYDFVIIDCLPSLGVLALNGLAASDKFLLPMQCEPYSMEGAAELINTVKRVKRTYNHALSLLGIVFTMYDKRLTVNREVRSMIRKSFAVDTVFKTEIPRNVKISESPSHGMPVIFYDGASAGAMAYRKLAEEFLTKTGGKPAAE